MDQISDPEAKSGTDRLFAGGGEVGAVLAGIDWSHTPLGPVASWPRTLRTSLRICLTSRHDIILWWGPDLIVFYNDAYAPTLGIHHPAAAGKPGREVWSEIWDVIGPMLEGVLATGQPTWSRDQLLYLERNGYVEETYHTYSYSPIEDDGGNVGGVFTAVTETTTRVLAERRAVAARDLAAAVVDARTGAEVCVQGARALETDRNDVPFALFYLLDREGRHAHLAARTSLPLDEAFAPADLDLETEQAPPAQRARERKGPAKQPGLSETDSPYQWPLARVARTGQHEVVNDLPRWPGAMLTHAAHALAPRAVVLPVTEPGQASPAAILIVGVNPHRALDEEYTRFYTLLASHLSSALASAHAYEEERRRAEALAAIDHAKTVFFSNVSHEFRTPLALMLGPLEDLLARRAALPPTARQELDLVHRNGLRLLKLVNTLLDFARIEAGRIEANYTPTDLATLTAELASSFHSLIEHAALRLVVDCPPLDEPVYVDRDMWEKVVLNLLSNAFKFTLAGTIEVRLRRAGNRGEQVALTVRDTGVGIAAAELPRLFERFHRVEGVRARTHEGSGIGLALVQELVQLHGGTIQVASAEGEGTTFTVTIPTGTAHLPSERIQVRSARASTALGSAAYLQEAERWLPDDLALPAHETGELLADAPDHTPVLASESPVRIVLADDNADMRDYVRRLLGEYYTVEAVGTGTQALAAIHRTPHLLPDLVISDVMMPELDGFGLLRALRADPRTANLPVIMLSARAGEEATIEGLLAGADDYLVKPFSAREILSRVRARLDIARTRADALRRARQLETIFEAAADGMVIYDNTGSLVQWNTALAELFEFERIPSYTGLPVATRPAGLAVRDERDQLIPAEDLPFMRAVRGEVLTGPRAVDLTVTTPSGTDKYVNVSAAPLHDETGQTIGAVAIYRDVTERRRLEQRTHEALAALLAMAEALAIGPEAATEAGDESANEAATLPVHHADSPLSQDHAPLMTPPAATAPVSVATQTTIQQLIALTRGVLRGQYTAAAIIDLAADAVHPLAVVGLTPAIERQWWSDLSGASASAYLPQPVVERLLLDEVVMLDLERQPPVPGQNYFGIASVVVMSLRLDANRVLVFGIETRDRSPFTPREVELARAATRLVALVLERERLSRARLEAEARALAARETYEHMQTFVGIAGHELRTPVTSLRINIQLAERALRASLTADLPHGADSKLSRAQGLLERADGQMVRLNRLIEDLLDTTRIASGKLEPHLEIDDLGDIVSEAVEMQRLAWPSREITLDLPDAPLAWRLDADRVGQVLTNYLTNALKYSAEDRPVAVSVSLTGEGVRVTVRDEGPGLTPEAQRRVWDLFHQVEGIRQQSGSGVGLGLGLYISKTIVERHGGQVGVDSAPGHGSTFWFTLPASDAADVGSAGDDELPHPSP
ncbi:MAG TPA: ATP-binding protein [Ktedonobacterales bacterium]|nr:ATP-binding protein [Ktedonobacterales bacterium]